MRILIGVSLSMLTGLAAQARIIPADRATIEGNATNQYPFSYSEVRFQQIWDGNEVANVAATLTRVEFRRDGSNAAVQNGHTWTYMVRAFETLVSPASMTTNWVNNRGGSGGTVVLLFGLNLPGVGPAYPTPQPWSVSIPFQVPFAFARSNGHLMLEFEANDPNNLYDPWPVDAENLWRTTRGDALRVSAAACTGINSEQVTLGLSAAATLVLGGSMSVTMNGTPLTAFANWIGTSNHTYLGLNLPFDLGALGAPGCFLGADIALQQVGAGPFAWPIPLVPSLENEVLFTQALALAPGANAGNFVTSDVFQVRLGGTTSAPSRFQSVYRRSDLGLATGFISNASFYGAIARFSGTFN